MSNVFNIKPSVNVSEALRNIADDYDNGDYGNHGVTIIIGPNLFHLGAINDDEACTNSIIDMQYGINNLMLSYAEGMEDK